MKKNICLLMFFLLIPLCLFAQTITPEPVSIWHLLVTVIVPILAGVWEIVGRIIPSVGHITIIGKIIDILAWISNFLNNKKKK